MHISTSSLTRLALAAVSALLYALAHTSLDACMPAPFIAFVPILLALRVRPFDLASIALFCALFSASMLFGTQHYSWPLYALAVLAVGGFHALPLLLYSWLARRARDELWLALTFAAGYTCIDFAVSLQSRVPIGRVAGALSSDVLWLQLAAYTGPFLIGFVVCLVNTLLAGAVWLLRGRAREAWRPLLCALGIVAGLAGVGRGLLERPPDAGAREVSVAVVQGSLTRDDYARARPGSGDFTTSALARYVAPTAAHLAREDFVIWPEVLWLSQSDALRALESIFRTSAGRVIGGFPIHTRSSSGEPRLLNAVTFYRDSARALTFYAKNHLVPFTEARFSPGARPVLLNTDLARFATPICFEAVFTHHVHTLLRLRPDAILVPSNDSGFGLSLVTSYMLKQAIVHAVAGRKYLVRAAQSGVSAIVDDRGRTLKRTKPFEITTLTGSIRLNRDATFYVEHGDAPGMLALTLLLLGLALSGRAGIRELTPGGVDS